MMYEIDSTRFLQPADVLRELQVLQQIAAFGPNVGTPPRTGDLVAALGRAYIARLEREGLVQLEQSDGGLRLTQQGQMRRQVLFVDYIRELARLHHEVIQVFKQRLVEFYLKGIRDVAFYPIGDTAEVIHSALSSAGLKLKVAVDDDPLLWGAPFHDVAVRSPDFLTTAGFDAVILTTAVFERDIRAKLTKLGITDSKIFSLWK